MTSIPWPEDLCSGTATWWLGYMAADSDVDDDRYPQLKAGAGIRVNFTPDVSNAVLYRGVEGNKTIMPLVSTGVIDDEGYLCTLNEDGTAGQRGVVLPSSECESLTPQDWTWNVTVTENRIRINRFSISLSPGEEIDLADYVPVDSSGGTHIVTEVETAERAEKAATQAGQFRQETKTDREATQRLRDEAESFRDEAGSSATSSAQSATSAGEILEQMQGMEITVDTSVGTRVFVGNTMIYGDTGWRDMSHLLEDESAVQSGKLELRRENNAVTAKLSAVQLAPGNSWAQIARVPTGFRNSGDERTFAAIGLQNNATRGEMMVVFSGNIGWTFEMDTPDNLRERPDTPLQGVFSWRTPQSWPTTLPGTPV